VALINSGQDCVGNKLGFHLIKGFRRLIELGYILARLDPLVLGIAVNLDGGFNA
jgi:hypothetical protein